MSISKLGRGVNYGSLIVDHVDIFNIRSLSQWVGRRSLQVHRQERPKNLAGAQVALTRQRSSGVPPAQSTVLIISHQHLNVLLFSAGGRGHKLFFNPTQILGLLPVCEPDDIKPTD